MYCRRAWFVKLFVAIICTPHIMFAQTAHGRISGEVTDSSGAAVAKATVTIENLGTHAKRVLDTSATGGYVAPGLEPGAYSVTIEAPGFAKIVRDRVQIEVANDFKIDFTLKPGAVTETVEVKDETPLTEATNAVLSGVLSNKAINELPLQGRDFQNLLALHPGVQRDPGGGFHSVTSNGMRPDDNNFIIDGATDNDVYWGETVVNDAGILGTPASFLPLDAIQEFNTQEQPAADFGAKPGVVVNIGIKSGTNHLHGTAYYFNRNAAYDARNFYNPAPQSVSALNLNQFGASIGGPILKDKWFYFVNYEGVRSKVGNPLDNYSPVTKSLATPDNPAGNPDASIVDAINSLGCNTTPANCNQLSLNLIKYFPNNPGYTASSSDPTVINFNFNNLNQSDNLVFKSDYHINEHNTISGRYFYANASQTEEDIYAFSPKWLSQAAPITQVFGFDWAWAPNSRWTNDARFSLNSFNEKIVVGDSNVNPTQYGLNTGVTDPRLFGMPTIWPSYNCCYYMGGNQAWPSYTSPSHTQNYSDTATFTMGRHTLRFGGIFSNGGVNLFRANTGRGEVRFNSLTDFLTANINSWSLLYGDTTRNISMKSWGLFAQDDFRATRKITLNLGLRYDVTYPIKDSKNRLANYVPSAGIVQVGYGISQPYATNYYNVSPRLGVALDVFGNGKTVVRSGFGMIYVQPSIRTFAFSSGGLNLNPSGLPGVTPGNGTIDAFLLSGADTSLVNWSVAGPIFPLNNTALNACSSSQPCDIFAVNQKLRTPYVLNWNLNVQQQITPTMVLQVAYVGNRGVDLYSTVDLNQADQSLVAPCYDFYGNNSACEQAARPMTSSCAPPIGISSGAGPCYPFIRFLNFLGNQSTSTYNGLQITLTQRYSHGLYLLAGYTYGHAIDTAGNTNNLGFPPQNSHNYAAEKASSDYDIRHRFTLSANYELPSKKSWAQMLEGWQINTIFMWQTGYPILLYDNTNDLTGTGEGPGNGNNDRWNIIGNPNNLKWSRDTAIPFFSVTYDPNTGNPIIPAPCAAAANSNPALIQSLEYAGGCFYQNGTTLYPNALFTFGNMGRNILQGPGFVNWDGSIAKVWRLSEKLNLQFRAEFFNLLNHSNFASGSISGSLFSSHMGQATATPDVYASNPVIGSGGSRHIQFGLKLSW